MIVGGFLVVVTQCLLLLTGTHHSYTNHALSLVGLGGGSGWFAGGMGGGGGSTVTARLRMPYHISGGRWRRGGGVGRLRFSMQYTPCSWGAVDTRCLAGQVNYTIDLQL